MTLDSTPKTLSVRVGPADCPSPHSLANKIARVLWSCVWTLLFRPSPRLCFFWRRWLLRCFGAKIGRNARISPSVIVWAPWNLSVGEEASLAQRVDVYCVDRIEIGAHATISQEAFLCGATHDPCDPHMRLIPRPIRIGDQAWVCARAFIAPGVTLGTGALAGACAVVTKDVSDWTMVVGNPAKFLKARTLTAN